MSNQSSQSPAHNPYPSSDQGPRETHGYVRVPRRDRGTEEIPRTTLCDRRLSYRARGVLGRLLANPDGYSMTSEDLATEGREGRDAVRTALRELEDTGYIARIKHQGSDGKWTTTSFVYDVPTVARLGRPGGGGGAPVRPMDPNFPPAPGGLSTGSTEDGFSGPGTEDGFPVVGFSGPGETEDGFSGAKSKSKSISKSKIKSESACAREGARATPPGATAWLPGVGDPDEAQATPTDGDRPEHQSGHQDARHDEDTDDQPPTRWRPNHSRGSRLPEDWQPDEALLAWAEQACPAVDLRLETEKFLDYWTGIPGAKGRKTSWSATWRNWIRRTDEQQQARKVREQQHGGKSKTLSPSLPPYAKHPQ